MLCEQRVQDMEAIARSGTRSGVPSGTLFRPIDPVIPGLITGLHHRLFFRAPFGSEAGAHVGGREQAHSHNIWRQGNVNGALPWAGLRRPLGPEVQDMPMKPCQTILQALRVAGVPGGTDTLDVLPAADGRCAYWHDQAK